MLYKTEVADIDHNQNQNKIKKDKKKKSIYQSIHILILIQNQFIDHIYTIYHKVSFDHDQKT